MQLLKMELRGFKSFADKTTLTFDKGITAIVGPNGSGKSNISDAVRWVMGEQNIRQLRGQKSEDIIFAGTENRKPQGAAEVSLYFDNRDHSLDIEFTEVVVTRRYFRSGDSEFYINKRPCRLKDIQMLFADTGIGQDSMAVIGQNRVDRILNSKPEERRIIFEEVAGISRFKARKQEGLRKIDETNRNLERIHDMTAVLEDQLGPLKEQAERLQVFRQLDNERISYEGTLTLQELRNAERLLTKAENSKAASAGRYDETAAELAGAEQRRQQLMALMEQEGETLRRLDEDAMTAHNELDSMKSRHEAGLQRQVELDAEEKQIAGEEQESTQKSTHIDTQRSNLETQKDAKQSELHAADEGFSLMQSLFHQAEAKAAAAEQELQNVSTANLQRERKVFVLQHDAEDLQRRLTEEQNHCRELETTIIAEKKNADAIALRSRSMDDQNCAAETAMHDTAEQEKKLRAHQLAVKNELTAAETEHRSLQGTVDSLEQRVRVMEGMEREHEGFGRTVKEIFNADKSWRKEICGVVAELCDIPTQYAAAIDVALGATARFVVTNSEQAAQSAVLYLKERHAGRTTFLPLDTVRGKHRTKDEEQAADEQGIIGFANELLKYDDAYKSIFFSLLGRTLIADTIDTGKTVARKYGHRLRIVCLDGTQFNTGGSLTGGSMRNREDSLIGRRVLLADLRRQLADSKTALKTMHERQVSLTASFQDISRQAKEAETRRQQASLERQKISWQAGAVKKEAAQAVSGLQKLTERLHVLQHTDHALQEKLIHKNAEWDHWKNAAAADTQQLETACTAARQEMENCRAVVTERQVAVATLREQVRHIQEQMEQNTAWKKQSAADMERIAQRKKTLLIRQNELKDMLAGLIQNIACTEEETKQKDAAKETFYRSKAENFRQGQILDEKMKQLREQTESLKQQMSEADVQLEKYHGEIRRSEEQLALQGLNRQEAMERRREGSLKELNSKVLSLRKSIADLGSINPNADEDYKIAAEKKQFFTKQCDDLMEAGQKLQDVVAEINEAMAKQFDQAFKQISGYFQQIFTRLFDGGTAKIFTTDSHDILNTGIEMLIQPPGKKQQQLTLLSGGERALTVIALLFAFLAYHPAPFCLVDEVDAALDEANVERLARYLKNYSDNTQFIVITHRRKTMEAANTLQGVTMEDKGVSRLLTVKVDELLKEGT